MDLLLKSRVTQFLANFPLLITGKFPKQVSEMQSCLWMKTLLPKFPWTTGAISQLPVKSSPAPGSAPHARISLPSPSSSYSHFILLKEKQNPLSLLGCGTFASPLVIFRLWAGGTQRWEGATVLLWMCCSFCCSLASLSQCIQVKVDIFGMENTENLLFYKWDKVSWLWFNKHGTWWFQSCLEHSSITQLVKWSKYC